jgi:hypothetical protein
MKSKIYILPLFLLSIAFMGCDNGNGLFGHSKTKAEAKASGSNVVEYVPDKTKFNLLDRTTMQIDTAWTEVSFTYKDGKRIHDSAYGYNFAVPYKRADPESFSFNFGLADTTNRVFTNAREENACQLYPRYLYDTIRVLLKQKSIDTSKGWMEPIITDTITFTKIK